MDIPCNPGDEAQANAKGDAIEREALVRITKMLGRPPTQDEIFNGKVTAAQDSRSFAEKMADEKFKPVKNGEASRYEQMLAAADEEVYLERYRAMSPAEQRREDIARLHAEEEAKQDAAASHAERLETHADRIEKLKQMETALNWNPDADEKDRQMVSQARQILETPGADLRPVTGMLNEIDAREHTRRINKIAELDQQADALKAQQAALAQQQQALSEGGAADASE